MAFAQPLQMPQEDDAFAPVLEALRQDPSTEFGEPGANIELIGRVDGPFSTVQRLRISAGARSVTAYAKILKPYSDTPDEQVRADRMLRREFNATKALFQVLQQDSEIGAVRPIAFLPEHRAVVTEEMPGQQLSQVLASASHSSPDLLAIARRIGGWIRIYQSIAAAPKVVSLAERRAYLDERLAQLEKRVISRAERQGVLATFDALAGQLGPEVPAVPIHADLSPTNIIVDGNGRIAVLDFTMAKMGATCHDISHLYFHLELNGARRQKREMMRDFQQALLAGYSPPLSDDSALFRLMLIQHAVCHVALLASQRRLPVVDWVYGWFVRRRWRECQRMMKPSASPLRTA